MLKELSIRNAKRQSKDYLLYFITLACTVSFMYAFNSLIFSDIVKAFPSIGVLPYMIIVASLLIVLIMGWIVGYMTKYILKKRSRELSIYMISGIPNRSICRLIFYENALIGIFAFVIGLPVGAFCVKVLKNEARCIQREYARRREQEKPLDDLTASELEQTATWDKYFMDEHVFEVQGLPVVVTGDLLAEAIAQLPEGKRDVILLSYFLGMSDREISERLNVVRQTISKRRLVTLKELREYLMKEGFEWPDK